MAREIPGFSIRFKDESATQRLLAKLLRPLNPGYLDRYITVFGRSIYWTSRAHLAADPRRSIATLLHERVHLLDWRLNPIWFPLSYVCFGPLFWTKRAHWERRGYVINLVLQQRAGVPDEQLRQWMVRTFASAAYGWMWPREQQVRDWVDRVLAQGLSVELQGELLSSTQAWVDRISPKADPTLRLL